MYGSKLKKIIKERGYSQKEIAKKINVPESTISSWINSENPPLDAIDKVCKAVNLKLWEFFITSENELKEYYPNWIHEEQIEFLKAFNQLPSRKRELILESFLKIVEAAL